MARLEAGWAGVSVGVGRGGFRLQQGGNREGEEGNGKERRIKSTVTVWVRRGYLSDGVGFRIIWIRHRKGIICENKRV